MLEFFGGGVGAAGGALGRPIAPRVDPNVRALRDAGVELTPGLAAGRFEANGVRNMAASARVGPRRAASPRKHWRAREDSNP
jgi:hypothetical protein